MEGLKNNFIKVPFFYINSWHILDYNQRVFVMHVIRYQFGIITKYSLCSQVYMQFQDTGHMMTIINLGTYIHNIISNPFTKTNFPNHARKLCIFTLIT